VVGTSPADGTLAAAWGAALGSVNSMFAAREDFEKRYIW
jgi:hypothetical protein